MRSSRDQYLNLDLRESARKTSRRLWFLLFLIVLVWSLLILMPAVLAANGSGAAATGLYSFFGYICHQLPDRSFHIFGHKLGVCSRCCGVYFGLVLGVLIYPFFRRINEIDPLPLYWLVLSMIPIGIDWSLTVFGIWENTFFTRFTTGLVLGTACSVFVIPALSELAHMYHFRKSHVPAGT
ncbi:MAG: DUF2085 domain-containing protein [Acidobacteriota bacterium]|nr:DUF2085 domain-containing protein [Acidobacteriota bacterium]